MLPGRNAIRDDKVEIHNLNLWEASRQSVEQVVYLEESISLKKLKPCYRPA